MAQQLTKRMFGTEHRPKHDDAFGLMCSQIRSRDFIHNGGWYNRSGEKLGWGDLNLADLQKIAETLEEDELFIILPERASFWNFVKHNPGIIGSMCSTEQTIEAPGVDYVAEHAKYIIAPRELYVVSDYSKDKTPRTIQGLTFKVLLQEEVRTMLDAAIPTTAARVE